MYRKFSSGWMKHCDFIVIDIICAELSYLLAIIIRHGIGEIEYSLYQNAALLLLPLEFMVGIFFSSYKNILRRGYLKELKAVFLHTSEVWAVFLMIIYLLRVTQKFSRTVFLVAWTLHIVFSYIFRVFWKDFLKKKLQENGNRALIIITSSQLATKTVEIIRENNTYGLKIMGLIILDKNCEGDYYAGTPVIARKENAEEYLCRNWVDEIFVNLQENLNSPKELIEACELMGITVHLRVARIDELKSTRKMIQNLAGYTVITNTVNTMDCRQAILKRLIDLCGGLAGTVCTFLICIFTGPIIFIKSPGPIFYTQIRIGKNGRTFKIYKFRSMYMDADQRKKELMEQNKVRDGMMFKIENDPRIIKGVGHFMRNHSLDEFPQFFNVLKGEMSIVGTRPPTLDEWVKYSPSHRIRMAAKPGITGMWQVSGRSGITDFEEVVKLDASYIREWSFALDLKIILKTIKGMFSGDGAA